MSLLGYQRRAIKHSLMVLMFVSLPLLPHMSPWVWLCFGLIIGYQLLVLNYDNNQYTRIATFIFVMLALALTLGQFHVLWGRDAGSHLLLMTFALKVLEINKKRDLMVFALLSYFMIIIYFLYSQDMWLLFYALLSFSITTNLLMQMQDEWLQQGWRQSIPLVAWLFVQTLPIALVLFVFFPRGLNPLWALPNPTQTAISGLSDELSPGDISNLTASGAVVFRARFKGEKPAKNQLYWRAKVFDQYDGTAWFKAKDIARQTMSLSPLSIPLSYTLTIEPTLQNWLPTLDMPRLTTPDLSSDFLLVPKDPVVKRQQLKLDSVMSYRADTDLGSVDHYYYARLPWRGNEKLRKWAHELRESHKDDLGFIEAVADHIRQQNYAYTLKPPLLTNNSIEEFFFDTKSGYCEHYASAFTYILRAAQIPARIVVGYLGGEYNQLDDYYIIHDYDAHAWVEVWLPEFGWLRADPTSWVAPERVDGGVRESLQQHDAQSLQGSVASVLRGEPLLQNKMRLMWDALNLRWYEWVIGYNETKQVKFLKDLGLEFTAFRHLAMISVLVVMTVFVIVMVILLRPRLQQKPSKIQRQYQRFCTNVAKLGLVRMSYEGPKDYAERISQSKPGLSKQVHMICSYYAYLHYGKHRVSKLDIDRFQYLVNHFVQEMK